MQPNKQQKINSNHIIVEESDSNSYSDQEITDNKTFYSVDKILNQVSPSQTPNFMKAQHLHKHLGERYKN